MVRSQFLKSPKIELSNQLNITKKKREVQSIAIKKGIVNRRRDS